LLIIESIVNEVEIEDSIDYYIISGDEKYIKKSIKLAKLLRGKNYKTLTDIQQKSFKSQMKDANKKNASNVIIIAEREMENNSILLKDMKTGEQQEVEFDDFINGLG
jgi:histidyl-tRNA synthetase